MILVLVRLGAFGMVSVSVCLILLCVLVRVRRDMNLCVSVR